MKAVLHPYQETAVAWLRERPEAALLLDMGLGKTLIALTAIVDLQALGEDLGKILVIAPLMTAKHVWPAEIAKWDHTRHLRCSPVTGSAAERERALRARADVYVVNRENVQWLADFYGPRWPFRTVVVDELSSFKSRQAKRWKALRRARPSIARLWGLTGTPAPNGLMDLWAQMALVDRGERLGRFVGPYRERYFVPGRRSGHVVYDWALKPGAEEAIFAAIGDVALSMRAKDELELPGRVDNVVEVGMPAAAMSEYRRFEREQATELLGEEVTAASAAALANKLMQWANGAVYDDSGEAREVHRAKIDALAGILDEAQGQPVLAFYAFRHDLERLRAAYPASETLDAKSDGLIERWNRGEVPLLLAHPQQAGHGLNLQSGGHIVVWYGLTWSLEAYLQANARLDRQGQAETVIVHHLVAQGTVDERVMEVLAGKRTLQDAMMDALRGGIDGPERAGD